MARAIAMDVRRGRFLKGYEAPAPLTPGATTRWDVPLRDRNHVFKKGHRIMVQIQSSWFPIIDRNPQSFVPDIAQAAPDDFRKAEIAIHSAPGAASYIALPVVPGDAE